MAGWRATKHPHKGMRIEVEIGYDSVTQWLNGGPLVACYSSFFYSMDGYQTP